MRLLGGAPLYSLRLRGLFAFDIAAAVVEQVEHFVTPGARKRVYLGKHVGS